MASPFILCDNAFHFFRLMAVSYYVMFKEEKKMKFETRAFNKDVEQNE